MNPIRSHRLTPAAVSRTCVPSAPLASRGDDSHITTLSMRPSKLKSLGRAVISMLLTAGFLTAVLASPVSAESITYVYDASNLLNIHVVGTFVTPGSAFVSVYDSTQAQINISTRDAGQVTTYAYDATSLLVQNSATITTPGTGTGAAYDSVNNQINISTESSGVTTTYAYDAASRQVQSASDINTPDDSTSTAYDSVGNQLNVAIDSNGNTTTYAYDATNRQIQSGAEINTPGHVTTTTYDPVNNELNMSVDELGHVTTYTYDGASRQVRPTREITTPGNVTTSFYDSTNRLIGITTNSNGVETLYLYDTTSRLTVGQVNLPGPAAAAVYDPVTNAMLITVVPEPSTLCLVAIAAALGGLLKCRRKCS